MNFKNNLILYVLGMSLIMLSCTTKESVTDITPCKNSKIFIYLRNKEFDKVKKIILEGKYNINVKDCDGYTLLMSSCLYGYYDMVEFLINHGADVNLKNDLGNTALIYAVGKKHFKIVKLLVLHGAHINTSNSEGDTPLIYAIFTQNLEMIKFLVNHGADVHYEPYHGFNAIITAVWVKSIKVLKFLLKYSVDVNSRCRFHEDNTPLMIAADNGSYEIVKLLLNHGAKVNLLNRDNRTALILAVQRIYNERNKKVVRLLLEHGALVNIIDKHGKTALDYVCECDEPEVEKLLRKHGAKTAKELEEEKKSKKTKK